MAYRVKSDLAGDRSFDNGADAFLFAKSVAREEGRRVEVVEASSLVESVVGTVKFVGPRANDFTVWCRIMNEWAWDWIK